MEATTKKPIVLPQRGALLGTADEIIAERLTHEIERVIGAGRISVASSLLQLRLFTARTAPRVMLLDCELLDGASLADTVRSLAAIAPVILLAPLERQAEIARLMAGGDVEYVPSVGDFAPLAASLIERRFRWAGMSDSLVGPPWAELPGDLGTIFRHEVNNPLTGILGNAELLLAHSERLSVVDTQRLQIIVDLAVRLRETTRRLSNAWENRHSAISA